MYRIIITFCLIMALIVFGCTDSKDTTDDPVQETTEEVTSNSPDEGVVSNLEEQIESNMPFDIVSADDNCFQVTIGEKEYNVCKGDDYDGKDKDTLPFEYEFDDDGNIIISYEGNKYGITKSEMDALRKMGENIKSLINKE